MVTIMKHHQFNLGKSREFNDRLCVMTKGNIFQVLSDSAINPDFKNEVMNELDEISEYVEIDCDSYKKFVYDKLLSIKQSVLEENSERKKLLNMIDALIAINLNNKKG